MIYFLLRDYYLLFLIEKSTQSTIFTLLKSTRIYYKIQIILSFYQQNEAHSHPYLKIIKVLVMRTQINIFISLHFGLLFSFSYSKLLIPFVGLVCNECLPLVVFKPFVAWFLLVLHEIYVHLCLVLFEFLISHFIQICVVVVNIFYFC